MSPQGPPGAAPPTAAELAAAEDSPITVTAANEVAVEDEAEAEATVEEPPPPPSVPVVAPPPPKNGRGLLISGGVVGGVGAIIKLVTTVAGARTPEPAPVMGEEEPAPGPMNVLLSGAFFYSPLIATGMALGGAGMGRQGHYDAHRELVDGTPARRKRRAALGWGLFGGGMLVWTVTRFAGTRRCATQRCQFNTWEAGYYISLAGTVPGILLGSYASGFARYRRTHRNLADLSVSPVVSGDFRGLSVSARF